MESPDPYLVDLPDCETRSQSSSIVFNRPGTSEYSCYLSRSRTVFFPCYGRHNIGRDITRFNRYDISFNSNAVSRLTLCRANRVRSILRVSRGIDTCVGSTHIRIDIICMNKSMRISSKRNVPPKTHQKSRTTHQRQRKPAKNGNGSAIASLKKETRRRS